MARVLNEVSVARRKSLKWTNPTGLLAARDLFGSLRSCQLSCPQAEKFIQLNIKFLSAISHVCDKPKLSQTSVCTLAYYSGTDSSCWRKTQ